MAFLAVPFPLPLVAGGHRERCRTGWHWEASAPLPGWVMPTQRYGMSLVHPWPVPVCRALQAAISQGSGSRCPWPSSQIHRSAFGLGRV